MSFGPVVIQILFEVFPKLSLYRQLFPDGDFEYLMMFSGQSSAQLPVNNLSNDMLTNELKSFSTGSCKIYILVDSDNICHTLTMMHNT